MSELNSREFQAHTERIEQLVARVNALPDAGARATALELLQSLMDLHGSVLTRLLELLQEAGDSGRSLLTKMSGDPLVCGLLVLYGLHPESMEQRARRAIERVSARVRKQGGELELIAITDTAVRVKLEAAGHGCGNSPDALKQTVEQAILEAAPEAEIIIEGVPSATSGFVPLNMLQPAVPPEMKEEKSYEESAA